MDIAPEHAALHRERIHATADRASIPVGNRREKYTLNGNGKRWGRGVRAWSQRTLFISIASLFRSFFLLDCLCFPRQGVCPVIYKSRVSIHGRSRVILRVGKFSFVLLFLFYSFTASTTHARPWFTYPYAVSYPFDVEF